MFNGRHIAKVISVAALAVVLTGGAASATTLRASPGHQTRDRHHGHVHHGVQGVFGTVASVDGTSTSGACGTSGSAGVFTLNGEDNTTFTVDVSATATTFNEHGMTGATFANVCVGAKVGAFGLISSGTVTATAVFVTPPPTPKPHAVFGTVASVNGTSTNGFCPLAGSTGVFTLTEGQNKTFTVDVGSTTKFAGHGVTSATFANVCVGAKVGAFGLISSGTVTATAVFVSPVATSPPHHATFEPSKVPHPNDHFHGHQGGSGSGEGSQSHGSGGNSGHHDS
ncbi:MAG TPA: hypothetical protein VMU64_02925 [Acidimicrobiales bacterium]|nr:hypothetical protein [Acidimicrobiales bacterium]